MKYAMRRAILTAFVLLFPLHLQAIGSDGHALPTIVYIVPSSVRTAIVENARVDHPDDYDTQQFVVRRQTEAYQALAKLSSKPGISWAVFSRIKSRVAADHPDDYTTQLFVINKQIAAFRALEKLSTPPGVATSDFFAIKAKAERDHPDDYTTQLYVIRHRVDSYQRMRGR
jgi:hypothetical protein